MPARKYSDDVVNQAAELREKGMSYAGIADKLKMTEGSVYYHCLKLGADSPDAQKAYKKPSGQLTYERGNHIYRRFTEEEDRQLIGLEAQGLRVSEICQRMNRKPNSVRARLMTLARIDERKEQSA